MWLEESDRCGRGAPWAVAGRVTPEQWREGEEKQPFGPGVRRCHRVRGGRGAAAGAAAGWWGLSPETEEGRERDQELSLRPPGLSASTHHVGRQGASMDPRALSRAEVQREAGSPRAVPQRETGR